MKKTILPVSYYAIASIRLFVFTVLSCTISLVSDAQCFASSTVSGSSATNDNGVGSVDFNNLGNSFTSDNNTAYATALVGLFNGSSHYLKVTDFHFSIPSYASICGVVVDIEKKAGGLALGAWIRDNEVHLVKNNVISGDDKGDHSTDWSGTVGSYSYGSSGDNWNVSLTPADVNSSNFGVAISGRMKGLAIVFPSAQIDNIKVTVYYNPILPVKLLSFNSSLKNNVANLQWETTGEEDNEFITVQRSIPGHSDWTDLARFEMHQSSSIKKYNYADHLDKTGDYIYRLKITNRDQQQTWSEIKSISYNGIAVAHVYPNPAGDHIILENINGRAAITITNMAMQRLNLPVQPTGEHTVKINTNGLPRGIYFITVDDQKLKFFKD